MKKNTLYFLRAPRVREPADEASKMGFTLIPGFHAHFTGKDVTSNAK